MSQNLCWDYFITDLLSSVNIFYGSGAVIVFLRVGCL